MSSITAVAKCCNSSKPPTVEQELDELVKRINSLSIDKGKFESCESWPTVGEGTYFRVKSVIQTALNFPYSEKVRYVVKVPIFEAECRESFFDEFFSVLNILSRIRVAKPNLPQKVKEAKKACDQCLRGGEVPHFKREVIPPLFEPFLNNQTRSTCQILKAMREGEETPLFGIESAPVASFPLQDGRLCFVTREYDGDLNNIPMGGILDRVNLSECLLHGLTWLIKKKVLHLDLHSTNYFRNGDDAYISDFGSAMLFPEESEIKSLEHGKALLFEIYFHCSGNPEDLPFDDFLTCLGCIVALHHQTSLEGFKRIYPQLLHIIQSCQIFAVGVNICKLFTRIPFSYTPCSKFEHCPPELSSYSTLHLEEQSHQKLGESLKQLETPANQEILRLALKMVHYDMHERATVKDVQDVLEKLASMPREYTEQELRRSQYKTYRAMERIYSSDYA